MIDRIVSALAAALAGPEPGVPAPAPPPVPPAIARPAEPPAPIPPAALKQSAPPPPPPAPTIWRLADATGQVWQHTDPAQLSAFVADRNRWFAHPAYSAPAPPAYRARGRCGPSGCPR